jgi:diguanylate cyclase (GGDEF)-like protein
MAGGHGNEGAEGATGGRAPWLSAGALEERLGEEIARSERHGGDLACLLVVVENLKEIAASYGEGLGEETPDYLAGALRTGLRRFDAVGRPGGNEVMIVLPGADGPRAEMVARRAMERLRAIKVEAQGTRIALQIMVGLTSWQEGMDAGALLQADRVAARAV